MHRLALAGTVLLALPCVHCGDEATAPSTTPVVALALASFEQQVLNHKGAAMVEFHRPTCPHCQAMVPTVERLAKDYSSRALVGTVNTETNPALSDRYQIEYVPTFVFFKNGQELSRRVGEQDYSTLAALLDAAIAAS